MAQATATVTTSRRRPVLPSHGPAPATQQDYAALRFADVGSGLAEALGTREQWLAQAGFDYATLVVAAGVLRQNDTATLAMAQRVGSDVMTEVALSAWSLCNRYKALAAVMEAAAVRATAGLSRQALLTGETV